MSVPRPVSPVALALAATDGIPNNPRLPVLHYPGVLDGEPGSLARAFEGLFDRHGWPAAWRNGIYAQHHFHSTAHEVLGIYQGTVRVALGGEGGPVVSLAPGDVVVLPAGSGHCRVGGSGRLGVVGAYPRGQAPDHCEPDPARLDARAAAVAAVTLPGADPVYGDAGPLVDLWRARPAAPD